MMNFIDPLVLIIPHVLIVLVMKSKQWASRFLFVLVNNLSCKPFYVFTSLLDEITQLLINHVNIFLLQQR